MAGAGDSILLRFKRRGLELTPGAHDITLEAPLSQKLQGVLQSYGEWEWKSLHTHDGNAAAGLGNSGGPASQDPISGGSSGQGSTPDFLPTGHRRTASEGAGAVHQATEHGSGHRRRASEDASQHWKRLNFLPLGLVVYLNPEDTPRQARLKNGHRLVVTAKKVKPSEEAPAASATPAPSAATAGDLQTPPTDLGPTAVPAEPTPAAPLALGSQLSSDDKQHVDVLCTDLEAKLTLASGSPQEKTPTLQRDSSTLAVYRKPRTGNCMCREVGWAADALSFNEAPQEMDTGPAAPASAASADPPTPGHAPAVTATLQSLADLSTASSSQAPAATALGVAQGSSNAGHRLDAMGQATGDVCSRGPSLPGSDSRGGQGSSGAGDMLDSLDQALAFMRRGDEASLQGDALGAAVQYSKGLQLLDNAPWGEEEVSSKMRILVEDMKWQLLECMAKEYWSMCERAIQGGNRVSLPRKILPFRIRSSLRLIELCPQLKSGYVNCAFSWATLGCFDVAMEVLFQGEAKLGGPVFQNFRDMLLERARKAGEVGLGAGARRREALEQALEEQRAWEASAEEDAQWLQCLSQDVVNTRVLANRTPSEQVPTARTALYQRMSGPVLDAFPLLLYSDEEVVRIETDPALASKDSFLRRLARASLPRGLYGELEPAPAVEQSRSSRRGRGKKKGATSRKLQEASAGLTPAPALAAAAPVAGPGEGSQQRVLARNLELARRCNVLGNRDATAGSMLGAAQWYTRGLLLAFPQAWATSCETLNTMQAETGPPGTKALALALLWSRSMAYQALLRVVLPLLPDEGAGIPIHMISAMVVELMTRATADALWCAYYGCGWWRGALCLAAVQKRTDLCVTLLEGEADSGAPGAEHLRHTAAEFRRGQGGRCRGPQRGLQPRLLAEYQSALAAGTTFESDFDFLARMQPKAHSALGALAEEARARGEL